MRRVIAILLLLTLLVPAAAADHFYSHRYSILGRVVDAEGRPVENVTVELETSGLGTGEPCVPQADDTDAWPGTPRNVTNAFGEFLFCLHAHGLRDGANFTLRAEDATLSFPADPLLRQSWLVLRLGRTATEVNETALAYHTVVGRIWRPTAMLLEGIRVSGIVGTNAPVNITLTPEGGEPIRVSTRANAFGDFAVRIPTDGHVTSGKVRLDAPAATREMDLSPHGATYAFLLMDPKPPNVNQAGGRGEDAPGSSPTPLPVLLALAAVAGGALLRRRRA